MGAFEVESFSKSNSMVLAGSGVVGRGTLLDVDDVCLRSKMGKKATMVAEGKTMKVAGDGAYRLPEAKEGP